MVMKQQISITEFLQETIAKLKGSNGLIEVISSSLSTIRGMGESSIYSSEIPVNKNEDFILKVKIDVYSEDISYVLTNIKSGLNIDIPIIEFDDIGDLKEDLIDGLEELVEDVDLDKLIKINSTINTMFNIETTNKNYEDDIEDIEVEEPKENTSNENKVTNTIQISMESLSIGDTISITKIKDDLALYTKVNKYNKGKTYYVDSNGTIIGEKFEFIKGEELPSAEFIQNLFKDMVESISTKDVVFEIIQNVYVIGKTKLKKILKF